MGGADTLSVRVALDRAVFLSGDADAIAAVDATLTGLPTAVVDSVGLVPGLGFTAAVISTLGDEGFGSPTVTVTTLIAIVIGAIAAGTIASALPARTAARRPVLDAIAAD